MSPSEREVALNTNDADGYVLVRPIFPRASPITKKTNASMRKLFPRNGPQHGCEGRIARAASLTFAPQLPRCAIAQLSTEDLNRRRRLTPTTVPE